MSDFFNDTMLGLLQAVEMEKGTIPAEEVNGMPARTFRAKPCLTNLPKELGISIMKTINESSEPD